VFGEKELDIVLQENFKGLLSFPGKEQLCGNIKELSENSRHTIETSQ